MVVAELEGKIVGFLQLLWAPRDELVVDLVAVDAAARGNGLAREMIEYAALHGTGGGRRAAGMRAGTQAANIPSVRLYEGMGFRLASAECVLHYHARASAGVAA